MSAEKTSAEKTKKMSRTGISTALLNASVRKSKNPEQNTTKLARSIAPPFSNAQARAEKHEQLQTENEVHEQKKIRARQQRQKLLRPLQTQPQQESLILQKTASEWSINRSTFKNQKRNSRKGAGSPLRNINEQPASESSTNPKNFKYQKQNSPKRARSLPDTNRQKGNKVRTATPEIFRSKSKNQKQNSLKRERSSLPIYETPTLPSKKKKKATEL